MSSITTSLSRTLSFLNLPFSIQWRAYLVRLPWLVPLSILKITSPEGPFPFIVYLPSRGAHKIPVYIFLPPSLPSSSNSQHNSSSSASFPLLDPNGETNTEKNAQSGTTSALPVHIDLHGGGFIMGSCLEQAPFCALLARCLNTVVISVDYRKGPLDQFPAAIHDAEDVLSAILDEKEQSEAGRLLRDEIQRHARATSPVGEERGASNSNGIQLDSKRLSISGFSAGGNIALNLAMSIDTPGIKWPSLIPDSPNSLPKVPVLLFYPSLDARKLPHERHRPSGLPRPPQNSSSSSFSSYSSFLPALDLSKVLMPTYLPSHQRTHPRASPGLADPKGMNTRARVLLVLPEFDSLAEESEVWVGKMRDAGYGVVDEDVGRRGRDSEREREPTVEVGRCKGMKHGWTQFPESWITERELVEKRRVMERTVEFVREVREGE